ncbi:MAG: rhombosortase [Candidatus Thiodiazotropha sp. (ex Ctena orbiculata)]|nr:rhombosortase [Candidatus Thiodiazotropha taylori]PUB90179.1 MAG: rhombosortase [gamma proteobacterium symbiont of Ctena orbiculata]MBT2998226.1 rhombosortase [Candidatus Thiodiazotropha taylori]MBT3002524.1 rhombosortase [Candidatus Thiodiazotropha taylori]MBT3028370.1 rhombosortase [Candidatus Thiodiazotropha taylori]
MMFPVLTIGTVLLSAIMMTVPQFHTLFYFELSPVLSGEWWRLLSGHLIHADWEHWIWNITALAFLGSYLERRSKHLWFLAMFIGIASVNMLLLSDWSQLTKYCGLSGALNTLLVIALFHYWRETRSGWVIVAAFICLGKLTLELFTGASLITDISWPPFPLAHLAGILAGVILIIVCEYTVSWVSPRMPSSDVPMSAWLR